MNNLLDYSLEDIKEGYHFTEDTYQCLFCKQKYHHGEIFKVDEKFFSAEKKIKMHIQEEHDSVLFQLMNLDKKYTSLTEKQKTMTQFMIEGMQDKEIADRMQISPSTVRHQRFILKEKAKQAKAYLAFYELLIASLGNSNETKDKVHAGATMIDERYFSTEKEEANVMKAHLASVDPLIMKTFPPKEKKKIILLRLIVKQFKNDIKYTEKEVNEILMNIYHDHVTLRRYLIEYGFMERKKDCSYYWVKGSFDE
ncbi:MAG: DUF2087 domain-containing protein [Clostridiales bacterium]|nr:DUF2087 domain-containing protein [Clostridiales bacterium]